MKKLFWVCLLAIAVAACLAAQDISATIGGTVLDPSGAAVASAKVTITNTDRNQVVRELTTETAGTYSAPLLQIGNYSIKVEAKGFKTETRTGIVLNVNDSLRINIALQVGAITETVEVKSQATAVELGTTANASTIEGTQVRELSLSTRNYEQLVAMMPGVTANSTDQLFIGNSSPAGTAAALPYSVNGNRNSANNWTVDGADNVDRGSNLTLMMFPSVDSIAEFKVERSLYTADTGRAGGAQINVVTKSGDNKYHGDLYEFVRNNAFEANNWINNAQSVLVNGAVQAPPLRWNDFGGTVSSILSKPAPAISADGLVSFGVMREGRPDDPGENSYAEYLNYAANSRTMQSITATRFERFNMVLTDGSSYRLRGTLVTGNYFATLHVPLAMGRPFTEDEARGAAPLAAIITYSIWQSQFQSAPNALGQTVKLNGYAATIVGVAPPHFHGTSFAPNLEICVPLVAYARLQGDSWLQDHLT